MAAGSASWSLLELLRCNLLPQPGCSSGREQCIRRSSSACRGSRRIPTQPVQQTHAAADAQRSKAAAAIISARLAGQSSHPILESANFNKSVVSSTSCLHKLKTLGLISLAAVVLKIADTQRLDDLPELESISLVNIQTSRLSGAENAFR